MKRQITISATSGAKNLKIENRLLTGLLPQPYDVSQTVQVKGGVFMAKLLDKPQFGLLPPNVRWISEDGRSLIIEEEPCYRNILLRHSKQGQLAAKVIDYNIPTPHLVYGISPDASNQPYVSHLYVANSPGIKSDKSYLFWLPLPNIFKLGAICTHTTINEHLDIPYHSMINRAISDFWSSLFNYDVDDYRHSSAFSWFYNKCVTNHSYGNDYVKVWEKTSMSELMDIPYDRISSVGKLKSDLLAMNHTYSFGLGEAERLMSNIVAISLENSISA